MRNFLLTALILLVLFSCNNKNNDQNTAENNKNGSGFQLEKIDEELTNEIYDWLEATGVMKIPLKRIDYPHFGDHRNKGLY